MSSKTTKVETKLSPLTPNLFPPPCFTLKLNPCGQQGSCDWKFSQRAEPPEVQTPQRLTALLPNTYSIQPRRGKMWWDQCGVKTLSISVLSLGESGCLVAWRFWTWFHGGSQRLALWNLGWNLVCATCVCVCVCVCGFGDMDPQFYWFVF